MGHRHQTNVCAPDQLLITKCNLSALPLYLSGMPAGWWQKVPTFPEKPTSTMQNPDQPPMYKTETREEASFWAGLLILKSIMTSAPGEV